MAPSINLRSLDSPVQFAEWATPFENDRLWLGKLNFAEPSPLVTYVRDGLAFGLPESDGPPASALTAIFISIEKKALVRFEFSDVIAFRVLDGHGLLQLWDASEITPRPARSTLRTRGHRWVDESPLIFNGPPEETPRFSYVVATDEMCLEVLCHEIPTVEEIGPAVVTSV